MDTWEHLLIRIPIGQNAQYVLEPHHPELDTNLQNVSDSNTVALLDELGDAGWELLSVDERAGRYWMKRRGPGRREKEPWEL